MDSALQALVAQLKAARERKGLSQRALGDRISLPQSHISKIESGAVDLQTSNLIEIARAVDLELTLVPRSALPAIRALQSSQRQETKRPISSADRYLRALRNRASRLANRYPQAKVLKRLIESANEMSALALVVSEGELRELAEALNNINAQLRKLDNAPRSEQPVEPMLREIELGYERLLTLRRALTHRATDHQRAPQPAYRLDDGGESDG